MALSRVALFLLNITLPPFFFFPIQSFILFHLLEIAKYFIQGYSKTPHLNISGFRMEALVFQNTGFDILRLRENYININLQSSPRSFTKRNQSLQNREPRKRLRMKASFAIEGESDFFLMWRFLVKATKLYNKKHFAFQKPHFIQ